MNYKNDLPNASSEPTKNKIDQTLWINITVQLFYVQLNFYDPASNFYWPGHVGLLKFSSSGTYDVPLSGTVKCW